MCGCGGKQTAPSKLHQSLTQPPGIALQVGSVCTETWTSLTETIWYAQYGVQAYVGQCVFYAVCSTCRQVCVRPVKCEDNGLNGADGYEAGVLDIGSFSDTTTPVVRDLGVSDLSMRSHISRTTRVTLLCCPTSAAYHPPSSTNCRVPVTNHRACSATLRLL